MHLNEQLATSKKILERQVDAVHPNRSSLTAYSSSFFTRSVYIAIEQTNINESSLNVLNFSMGQASGNAIRSRTVRVNCDVQRKFRSDS